LETKNIDTDLNFGNNFMGIRIKVILGWGFRRCRYQQDPRFNPEIFGDCDKDYLPAMFELNEKLRSTLPDWRQKDFELWTKGKLYGDGKPIKELTSGDFLSYCTYNTDENEEGKISTGPIVFTSPEHKDWYRYDDVIDYYTFPPMTDSVKMIVDEVGQPAQVYPYCAFVNRKTGSRPLESKAIDQTTRWLVTKTYFESPEESRRDWKWEEKSEYVGGAKSIIEWQRDIVPEPPYIIRLFCEAANVFKNPLTVYRLKPMVVSYWD
jgi:hypothetical protein